MSLSNGDQFLATDGRLTKNDDVLGLLLNSRTDTFWGHMPGLERISKSSLVVDTLNETKLSSSRFLPAATSFLHFNASMLLSFVFDLMKFKISSSEVCGWRRETNKCLHEMRSTSGLWLDFVDAGRATAVSPTAVAKVPNRAGGFRDLATFEILLTLRGCSEGCVSSSETSEYTRLFVTATSVEFVSI